MAIPSVSSRKPPQFKAPLAVGDIAPDCALKSLGGEVVDLRGDAIAGHPIAIVFCPKFSSAVTAALAALLARRDDLDRFDAKLFAVTLEGARVAMEQGLPMPVLLDRTGDTFRAFNAGTRELPTTIVLRPNHHVFAICKEAGMAQPAETLAALERIVAERRSVVMRPHPPVLIVPEVLSRTDCARLINVYRTRGQVFVEPRHGDDDIATDYKMRIPEYGRRDRIDHWLVEAETVSFIDSRLQTRLFPDIHRAFQYQITRRERMRIGCYEGERGGELHGHRDNAEPIAAYRRFAVSINLNTEEFEGGDLRFPEFGDQRYRPETGAAIVFSCSLLHEAMRVISGTRFVLLAFLFGDH
ncbi:MAG TPA: redoxin domain-containing protein [Stellaceae bacterium]|nr:redoxin domain-containing protein [Stellaceae bacterium]